MKRAVLTLAALTLAASVTGTPGAGIATNPVLTATDLVAGEASSFVVAAPALRHGTLSFVDPKYGSDYLALPEPRGTVATICAVRCVTRRSTDYGPDQRVHPNRIADLSAADFVYVCQKPLSAGLCVGTVEIDPPVHVDDDRMRSEDGGPVVTLPPTDTGSAVVGWGDPAAQQILAFFIGLSLFILAIGKVIKWTLR